MPVQIWYIASPLISSKRKSVFRGNTVSLPNPTAKIEELLLEDTSETLLAKIDSIWRSEHLFQPSTPIGRYINNLIDIATKSQGMELNISNEAERNLVREFLTLKTHPFIRPLRKAIILTQALELALTGIDSNGLLRRINHCRINDSSDDTSGIRHELLAAWYLVKFILPRKPGEIREFILEKEFNMGKGKLGEIDIITEDSLISVSSRRYSKGTGSRHRKKLIKLFSILVDKDNRDLLGRTKKLILVRNTHDLGMLAPSYSLSERYANALNKVLHETEACIEQDPNLKDYLDIFKRLKIEIHYIPHMDDTCGLCYWVQQNYRSIDEKGLLSDFSANSVSVNGCGPFNASCGGM